MGKKFDFDLIVIGSGPAGSAAALSAAEHGLNIAIAENSSWGGTGVNTRDLPFCSATSFSNLYHDALLGSRFGLSSKTLRFNYPVFRKWLDLSKRRSGANSKKAFEKAGITCLKGIAHFLSPYEVSIGEKIYSAKRFIISSGSVLYDGGIIGAESVKCLTPETALEISRLPKSIVIIGGGSTGCEFADFFASLGVKVTVFELSNHLLPKEDSEAGNILEKYFEEEYKIKTLTEARVISVSSSDSGIKLIYLRGGLEKTLKAEEVLLATGSKPALDLGLGNAGVLFDKNGILVNQFYQTTMKHIFAAGDCLGGESSSERVAFEGMAAALNLIKKTKYTADYNAFPRLTKTNPEIVSIGLTESQCKSKKIKFEKTFVPLSETPASNTSDFRVGFLKLLVDKKKKTVLGAVLMCKDAELIAGEFALIIKNGITVSEVARTPHISSSFAELIHLAAQKSR